MLGRQNLKNCAQPILATCLATAWLCLPAFALNPHQPIKGLYHSSWTGKDGIDGIVTAIAQTSDGYLWVGTTTDLFRFDGLAFERYKPSLGSFLANSVSTLLALPSGGLWIGYIRGGATFLHDGTVINYSAYSGHTGFPVSMVRQFAQDWEGTIWAAVVGGLARLEGDHWRVVRGDWSYPGRAPTALLVDNQGTLWVADRGLIVFLPKGEKKFHSTDLHIDFRIGAFAQRPNGDICFFDTTHKSIHSLPLPAHGVIAGSPHSANGSRYALVDRDGMLWAAGFIPGVARVPFPARNSVIQLAAKSFPGLQTFGEKQGLTDDESETLFEDREGNIWVGTNNGLDRFRYRNLNWHALLGPLYLSLIADDSGGIWVGTDIQGVIRLSDRKTVAEGPQYIWLTYRAPDGIMWFSAKNGLWKWKDNRFLKLELPDKLQKLQRSGNKDPIIISAITQDSSGALWVSISGFGIFQLRDGNWKFVEVVSGHPDWAARSAFTDSQDNVWLVYGEIVAKLSHGQVQTFAAKDGLSIGPPNIVAGFDRQVWVGGEFGVAFLRGNKFYPLKAAEDRDLGLIAGMVATGNDGLWLATGQGIVHVAQTDVGRALANPNYKVNYDLFDLISDLPEPLQTASYYSVSVMRDPHGLLWFAARNGVASIDPTHIIKNTLPPPVSIRSVAADDKAYSIWTNVSLPPETKNLQINYAALSMAIPERVRFRYRLEGSDKDWQDAGTRRQAFYRDLRPGSYQFHVIACNNDGVWNETGATLNFSVAPAWYQTKWFQAAMILLTFGVIFLFYLFERQRYATLLRIRFNERLEERTRLARELHDTLLQTIQGSQLVAVHARENLKDLSQAQKVLDRLCEWLDRATVEGRAALNSLRGSGGDKEDLSSALRQSAELCAPEGMRVAVSVTGLVRSMQPVAREEVLRIGEEAVRNACLHSHATLIEIEVRYGAQLTLRIRDNGVGLDAALFQAGKLGHFGIVGMRERAARIGARLSLEASAAQGTSLVLTVPKKVIFN